VRLARVVASPAVRPPADAAPAPPPAVDAAAIVPVDPYLAAERARTAPTVAALAAFLEEASEVHAVRVTAVHRNGAPPNIIENGSKVPIEGEARADLVTFARALAWFHAKACVFDPGIRIVAVSGSRTLTIDLCLKCGEIQTSGAVELRMYSDNIEDIRPWAADVFGDPRLRLRE
jgi:hypothetical protein